VCAQIRRLTEPTDGGDPLIDKDLWAGTIAQARSLAHSIDNVDGRNPLTQANGVPLSQMHLQLDALMARLNPEVAETDTMGQLLAMFREDEARQREASAR
jgi:hypothetical protein